MKLEEQNVLVPAGDGVILEGTLAIPEVVSGAVLFAHGSGSSRHSPRNRHVANVLHEVGLATLLIDLLTLAEEDSETWTHELRFDIGLLAGRLIEVTRWLHSDERTRSLSIGYFGASTGAAAALVAAAREPDYVHAVVSRGGRPDLAGDELPKVRAPTLLIVGGDDVPVIEMNRAAFDKLSCEKRIEIVPFATHLFEEPGALDRVADLASSWFAQHLSVHF